MQGANLETGQEAIDIQIQGPEAKPVRGLNATIDYNGNQVLDSDLERILSTILEEADQYRKRFVPEWLKGYQQYNGEIKEDGKLPWQSRINIPKPKQAVDLSAARIMESIFSNEDFFDILPFVQGDDTKTDTAKKMIKWQLGKSDYYEAIQTSVKDALISGFGPMKVMYEQTSRPITTVDRDAEGKLQFKEVTEYKNRLRLDAIMPTDFWLDPTGRNRWVIQKVRRSLSDIWTLAKDQIDPTTQMVVAPAVYDYEKVKDLRAGNVDPERDAQNALIKRESPIMNAERGIDVYEFWGDIHDPATGVLLFRNVVATFVNKKTLIRRPQSNPLRHGNSPFVIFHPVLAPHQVYGYGMLTSGFALHDALNRAWNIVMDKMLLQVPTVQAYPSSMRNPNDLGQDNAKFYPGKMWEGKDPEKAIFVPVDGFQPPSDQDFVIVDKLGGFHDQSTGVNEFATGTPQTNNRKTKEEVQQRSSATEQVFNDAARQIEKSGLTPLIKQIYYLTVQFETNFNDPKLLRMFGEQQRPIVQELAEMTPEERWQAMYLDAEFRVTGVSLAITRNDRIQRMMNWKQITSQDPAMNAITNRREEMRFWLQVFDLPQQMILDPDGVVLQAEETMLINQILGPASGEGGMGQNANNAAKAGTAKADSALAEENAAPKSKEQQ